MDNDTLQAEIDSLRQELDSLKQAQSNKSDVCASISDTVSSVVEKTKDALLDGDEEISKATKTLVKKAKENPAVTVVSLVAAGVILGRLLR